MEEKDKINKIFKAYDIRGLYKKEFDEDIAKKTAQATANFLNAKKLLVAMDNRESSKSLKKAVLEGLLGQKVNIIDIGITTTPMFYWAINKENTGGGIMITASHNPPEYNGLKISKEKAAPVGENSGLADIKKLVLEKNFKGTEKEREIFQKNLTDDYINFLSKGVANINLKIAADFSCGASSEIVKKLSEKLHISLAPLCSMEDELKHEGNPLKDENVKDLKEELKNNKYDFGVAFDTDADRIFFFEPNGERIDSGIIASILAENYLKKDKKARFVGSENISKTFSDAVKENKGEYFKSRVGHVFLKEVMREHNATFGAELSGHFYFKDFYFADSGIFTLVQILKIMAETKKSITELTENYKNYYRSGELNFKVKDKDKALLEIKNFYKEAELSEQDGITLSFPNFWLNIRASNTEPLLRVNIEADTKELLDENIKHINTILL
jgi:phosphomannomutase